MAQLVEGDRARLGALERLAEAADELGAVERVAGLGVAEDEVLVARVKTECIVLRWLRTVFTASVRCLTAM
jgi:hypothetical protein